jgi:hypothetical protein
MQSSYDVSISAENEEKRHLNRSSISQLKFNIIERIAKLEIPVNKDLLVDIVIDLQKETGELPR